VSGHPDLLCPEPRPGYFFGAAFFATAGCAFASAFFAAQRFFKAATIAAFPATLSFRLGFDAAGFVSSTWPLDAAHLFRCASAIAFRPGTHLPPSSQCGFCLDGRVSGTERKHGTQIGNLSVNPAFLLLEAENGCGKNRFREFGCRHVGLCEL
jgi:hypothetical protein